MLLLNHIVLLDQVIVLSIYIHIYYRGALKEKTPLLTLPLIKELSEKYKKVLFY